MAPSPLFPPTTGVGEEVIRIAGSFFVVERMRAAEEGKLFGSITSADIDEKMAEQGVEIDRKQIKLDEPIKSLGVHSVPVRLHADVRPELKVWVIKEE